MFHRFKTSPYTDAELRREVSESVVALRRVSEDEICQVFLFGSASRGVASMHQYSDIDICVVIRDHVDVQLFNKKLPISKKFPVDWIVIHQSEFNKNVQNQTGVFSVIAREGKVIINDGMLAS